MNADADEPRCPHPGCTRAADYGITLPDRPDEVALRCRWHADAVWRPHGGAATVSPLYSDVPPIDTARAARRPVLPVVVAVVLVLAVLAGFAALAPVLL